MKQPRAISQLLVRRPLTWQLALLLIVAVLFTALTTTLTIRYYLPRVVQPLELARQQRASEKLATTLEGYVQGAKGDLLIARDITPVERLREATGKGPMAAAARAEVGNDFLTIMGAQPHFLQLRLLGRDGREQVRVHRTQSGERPTLANASTLQDKAQRPYFQRALQLATGEVYVSPLELNQEHGKIQVPHVPVLRLASPVQRGKSPKLGVVVINVDMRPILDQIRTGDTSTTYLVNSAGEFLIHQDRAREYQLELGTTTTFPAEFPGLTDTLNDHGSKAYLSEGRAIAATSLRLIGGPPLLLITEAASEAALAERSAYIAIALSTTVAVLIALLSGIAAIRSLTAPLAQMTRAVQRFDIARPPDLPDKARGEVGALAHAFERLHDSLRQKSEALERQRSYLESMVEAAPNASLVVDESGKITHANRAAETLFGYGKQELVGAELDLLLPEEVRSEHPKYVRTFLAAPQARPMGSGRDLHALHRNGRSIPVEIGLGPLEGNQTVASIVDITQRKQQEIELKRSNEELEQFAYVASHDLQEPLRIMSNYAELLAELHKDNFDEKTRQRFGYIVDNAHKMQSMIRGLLAYSRLGSQSTNLQTIDVATLVSEVLENLEVRIQETNASIEVGPLPKLRAEASALTQIFQNLIGNAIKFAAEQTPQVRIAAEQRAGLWTFSIQDNGVGIEAKYKDKIFMMFQRLHPQNKFEGSGIGLTLVKRAVERHSGKVWFESSEGGGTTFYFTIAGEFGDTTS